MCCVNRRRRWDCFLCLAVEICKLKLGEELLIEEILWQVQLGEELLSMGEEEAGVEHLSNAVAVCGQPNQLLQVLQQTLPQHVFQLLLMRLPTSGQVTQRSYNVGFLYCNGTLI